MGRRRGMLCAMLAPMVCAAHGQDDRKPVHRVHIEVLYTMHASVDTDGKLERIRALVVKAYPEAKFAEVIVEDQRTYFAIYSRRLLRMSGTSLEAVAKDVNADGDPKDWDAAVRERFREKGFAIARAQVAREVALRSIYGFLLAHAKQDVSLKTIFDKLRAKDDATNAVCGTEPGKSLIVYRDLKGLSGDELEELEDRGVRFSSNFRVRVLALGTEVPRLCWKPDGLGEDGEGRQIFRLVGVTPAPAPSADPK